MSAALLADDRLVDKEKIDHEPIFLNYFRRVALVYVCINRACAFFLYTQHKVARDATTVLFFATTTTSVRF